MSVVVGFGCTTQKTPSVAAVPPPIPAARATETSSREQLSVGKPISIRPTDLVAVSGAFLVDFWNGSPAVVIEYETRIPISDMPSLTAEADKLMQFFRPDVEATGVSSAVLRASYFEGYGMFREGNGYGFVYDKSAIGTWARSPQKAK